MSIREQIEAITVRWWRASIDHGGPHPQMLDELAALVTAEKPPARPVPAKPPQRRTRAKGAS